MSHNDSSGNDEGVDNNDNNCNEIKCNWRMVFPSFLGLFFIFLMKRKIIHFLAQKFFHYITNRYEEGKYSLVIEPAASYTALRSPEIETFEL